MSWRKTLFLSVAATLVEKNYMWFLLKDCSRCREDKLTLPCAPRPLRIQTELCQYSLSITSYFLSSGVFLHLTEIFFCFTEDITVSATSLAPALLTLACDLLSFRGTQQITQGWHLQMAEFREHSLRSICSRKSPTCTCKGFIPGKGFMPGTHKESCLKTQP